MTDRIEHYFIDTNVLVQCRPLAEIAWRDFSDADELRLIISRPVQSEIDDHKNKGGDRLAKRARKASSLIREIILADDGQKVIKSENPLVTLAVNQSIRPSPDLAGELDYNELDDRLVGTTHAFSHEHPEARVFLLTHDTGPLATARMVSVLVKPVPDEWLLPPEPSDSDRKLRALEAEIAKLRDKEPRFSIRCVTDEQERQTSGLDFAVTRYDALSSAQLSELINALKHRAPVTTDFGSREPAEREPQGMRTILSLKEVYEPVTDEEIADYKNEYQDWLNKCDAFLSSLHDRLNGRYGIPEFKVLIGNDGNRPANDALVTFRAMGALSIMPPPYRDDEEEEDVKPEITLPAPPTAPRGQWHPVTINDFAALRALSLIPNLARLGAADRFPEELLFRSVKPHRRDPNSFYFKPERPSRPVKDFSIECEQWRHGIAPEEFFGLISFDNDVGSVSGAIECEIHAENISTPVKSTFPVKIEVRQGDTKAYAEDLISRL